MIKEDKMMKENVYRWAYIGAILAMVSSVISACTSNPTESCGDPNRVHLSSASF